MTGINRCLIVIAIACSISSSAFGQSPAAQALPDWTRSIRLGSPVFLTLLNGERIEGVAGSVTRDGIGLTTLVGSRTARFSDIRRAERRDPTWDGVALGAGLGAAIGLGAVFLDDTCGTSGSFCGTQVSGAAIGGAIYGALIGWGIDALVKGRKTMFDGPNAPRVSLGASPKGITARLTVSW